MERRVDPHLSTLRRYVEALGGRLQVTAQFPDRAVVLDMHATEGTERADAA